MKKLLCCLFAAVLLAGCGGGDSKATRTCTKEEDGMKMQMIAEAKDEKSDVEKVTLKMDAKYEDMGFEKEDLALLGMDEDDFTDLMEASFLASVGVEEGAGVEVVTNELGDDGYHLLIEIDIEKLSSILGSENEDLSLDSFVKSMEDSELEMDCE